MDHIPHEFFELTAKIGKDDFENEQMLQKARKFSDFGENSPPLPPDRTMCKKKKKYQHYRRKCNITECGGC